MSWLVKLFPVETPRTSAQELERMRNLLAFALVGSFVSCLPALLIWPMPKANETILTYMVGQLSGMALTVIGFYFVSKVGQEAQDAQRAATTGKLVDMAKDALSATPAPANKTASAAADEVAEAATDKAAEIGDKA